MTTTTTTHAHPFEARGLGMAPFRCVGVSRNVAAPAGGLFSTEQRPGGSCDYCGTGIVYECWIVSADGKRFKVGCDCVEKTHGARDVIVCEVLRAKNAILKADRDAKAGEKIRAAKLALPAVRATLATRPHPNEWHASQGKTLADWCEWMLANAGQTGKLQAAKVIATA